MKVLLTIIAAYAVGSSFAYAQPDESREFIYLYSDSIIYAKRIDLERNYTGSVYLWADAKRIHPEQVKFFNNNRGFFANVKDLDVIGRTHFSERIRQGKINLFEAETVNWDAYDDRRGYHRPAVVESKNYYNKGYGSLRKANYVNLSIDLADNPRSMAFLKKYRSTQRTQVAMYVAAGLSFLSGVAMTISKGGEEPWGPNNHADFPSGNSSFSRLVPGLALTGVGLGLATGGYFIGPSRTKQLKQAVDAYND
ncbi:hypothetical protein [Arcticibacter sp.]|jgi:hypothetical protein|uniref:hypothetical protein n=1 Tax=Arcticibacter sp. TaxID=1872630 RepID=UPI00388F9B09